MSDVAAVIAPEPMATRPGGGTPVVASVVDGPGSPNSMGAMRAVLGNRAGRGVQMQLAAARTVDLAQLVVLSAFLFAEGGPALVATYGIVRTLVPALGVPAVTAIGCRLGPSALLGLLAGVAAIGSFVIAAVAATGGPIACLLAGAGLTGVALGCFRPVVSALLPALARSPSELLASNAVTGFFVATSTLVGPVLGSLVGLLLGVPALLVLTGGGMCLAAFVAMRLRTASGLGSDARSSGGRARLDEYLAGARELRANAAARLVTLLGTTQTFVRGAMSVVVVAYAIDVLSTGGSGVGALYGAMGLGALVSLPIAVVMVKHVGVHRSLAIGIVAWGAPLAVCGLVDAPVVAALLFGVIGVGNSTIDICYYVALQRAVADRVLTRVLGVVEAMLQAGVAAGAFAGALLLKHVDPTGALVVVGLVLPCAAVLSGRRLWSLDHRLDTRDREIALLRGLECFALLPLNVLDQLAVRMSRVRFATGQALAVVGEPRGSYLVIEEGTVEIAHGGRIRAVLGPGQGFGEVTFRHLRFPSASATARTAVRARAIDGAAILEFVDAHPPEQASGPVTTRRQRSM